MNQIEVKDAIRNDLRRIARWEGDLLQDPLPQRTAIFINHANKLMQELPGEKEKELREELIQLQERYALIQTDPQMRIQWAEKILTLSCRL